MSEIHVRQIRAALEKTLQGRIDMADLGGRPAEEVTSSFLSRSLAAFSLMILADIEPDAAAAAVTDGGQDNGIDAMYFHAPDRLLFIVQSKWRHDGSGSLERGEVAKFIIGFRDLVNARFERFNQKVQAAKPVMEAAITDARTRMVLVLAYTGQEPPSQEVASDLSDLLTEMNDPVEVLSLRVLRQVNLYNTVAQGIRGGPIDVEVALYDWGQIREPFQAYYGQVSASDIARWWNEHYPRILAPNIRMFLGETDVNEGLMETLTTTPDKFWYFNNGITALCASISKKPLGGASRDTGIFECRDLHIVNGAQTVGAIAAVAAKLPDSVNQARVPVRLISLETCPQGFDRDVTRCNNTQNRIERREFIALDPEQERIRNELLLDGVTYAYKSGDVVPSGAPGFDLTEATVARACAQLEISLAVQAKREIGKLWEDIDRPPYRTLFNPAVSGPDVWKLVQVLRRVEERLTQIRNERPLEGKAQLLSFHGNRFMAHMLFMRLPQRISEAPASIPADLLPLIDAEVTSIFDQVLGAVNANFPDAYLGSLFKNQSRCRQLLDAIQ